MTNSTTNIDQSSLLYGYESGIMDSHLTFQQCSPFKCFTCLLETKSLDPKYEHLSKNIFVQFTITTIVNYTFWELTGWIHELLNILNYYSKFSDEFFRLLD